MYAHATENEISASPCKEDFLVSFPSSITFIVVLVLDFYCTRNFALGMEREQQQIQRSVSLAETVVTALVRFDLEEAEWTLQQVDTTPLTETFGKLLQNLHQYRPYLPDSLFTEDQDIVSDIVKPPQDNAAIVFTDIKSSTAIWEASPGAMKKALKIHNKIIRNCINEFRGYEVKTIGDSFMIAFDSISDGCLFAIEVQEALTKAIWPVNLKLPSVFEVNSWKGLTVRIGIFHGEVSTEVSLCGRTDYLGRTVNKAARLEGVCYPWWDCLGHNTSKKYINSGRMVPTTDIIQSKGNNRNTN